MSASVKVMLSYDYCHFEIAKSTDQPVTDQQIDDMRKDCMRLADKAISQFKVAKNRLNHFGATDDELKLLRTQELAQLRKDLVRIQDLSPCDRTPEDMAKVALFRDRDWDRYINERYDYQDDWDHRDDCDGDE